jgi:hypothetical protein
MALPFTDEEVTQLRDMLTGYDNGLSINDLPPAELLDGVNVEVQTPAGASQRVNLISAVSSLNRRIAVRRWNETLATPIGEAWGNIDFLRELPYILGLGGYLVTNDRQRRKLDPTNHYRFADGSPAALDGSMGQYMWGWNSFYYGFKKEGNYYYECVSREPLPPDWESYYIPAGGTSALGAGVIDRLATGGANSPRLCSLISDAPRYRGGANHEDWDGLYNSLLGMPATAIPYRDFSTYARERGQGWEAGWYVARSVQEILFRLIMGSRHSQMAWNPNKDANGLYSCGLGMGATEFGYWGTHNDYNPAIKCSAGVELGDGVGVSPYAIKNSSGDTIYTAPVPVFFGLKNMWGHLWQVVSGEIVFKDANSTKTYIAPSLYGYGGMVNSISGMLFASENPHYDVDGELLEYSYIKKISTHFLCGMPTEIGASSSTYFGDLFWNYVKSGYLGFRVRLSGSSLDDGTHAGAVASNANDAVAVASQYVSAPLCYFEEDPIVG